MFGCQTVQSQTKTENGCPDCNETWKTHYSLCLSMFQKANCNEIEWKQCCLPCSIASRKTCLSKWTGSVFKARALWKDSGQLLHSPDKQILVQQKWLPFPQTLSHLACPQRTRVPCNLRVKAKQSSDTFVENHLSAPSSSVMPTIQGKCWKPPVVMMSNGSWGIVQ